MIVKPSAMLVAVSLTVLVSWAHAADIYRWVDEKGKTHIADTVPPEYRKRAEKVDTSASEVSEKQRAEASARANRQKAATTDSKPSAAPRAGVITPANKPGASGLDDARTRCEERRRIYAESQRCFGQYTTVFGIQAEAYQHCTEIPDPSPDCGIPTN